MKKIIKFRGKEINSGQWVYGFYTQGSFIGTGEVRHIIDSDHLYDVSEASVGQFTGLFDKNGKEIYEGDIVRTYVTIIDDEDIEHEFFRVGVIRFTRGQFALTRCTNYGDKELTIPHRWSTSNNALYTYPAYRSEVIGNIHDNHEYYA